jgi:hypothetical protein
VIDGLYAYELVNETLALELFSYSNGSDFVNVVDGELFLDNGQTAVYPSEDCTDTLECPYSDDHVITCTFATQPKTGWQLTLGYKKKPKSFFFDYVLYYN